MRYDGPPAPDPSHPHGPTDPTPSTAHHPGAPDHSDPHEPPDPGPSALHGRPGCLSPAAGRRRRRGPARRRAPHRPGLAVSVLAAGTAATAVTVLLGLYGAHPPTAPPPRAATPPTTEAPPPSHPTRVPTSPPARAGERGGTAPDGLAPRTGAVLAAPEAVPSRAAGYVEDVIALANAERERAGCGPLRSEARLARAAQGHADDMAARDYYAHDSPEGRDGGDRMTRAGYDWSAWGENIHKGPKTPRRVMDDWMDSTAHRANILNCSFRDIGVGVALTADGPWWVQDLGTRN